MLQQIAQRTAGDGDRPGQSVHFEIMAIAEHQARVRIEHQDALLHVVQNGVQEVLVPARGFMRVRGLRGRWERDHAVGREFGLCGIHCFPPGNAMGSPWNPTAPLGQESFRRIQWIADAFNQSVCTGVSAFVGVAIPTYIC
jgi:hypothetical protein